MKIGIPAVVYSPPLEEEEQIPSLDWEKETIQYVLNNKSKILKIIRSSIKNMNGISSMDIEDIYSDTVVYLYNSGDYDIIKAVDCTTGKVVSLEGYVNLCVKNCVKRYITQMYKREKKIVRGSIKDDEGREKEILDIIADKKTDHEFEKIEYNVKENLDSIEYARYKYGTDIFLILYVRMLTLERSEESYKNILNVLGISKKELTELEKKIASDEEIFQVIKEISACETMDAVAVLQEKVYCSKQIKDTILSMK